MNAIHRYYHTKYCWSDAVLFDIDWAARDKASKKLRKWKFVTKLSCEWLPTNHRLHLIEGIPPDCALCGQDETVDHLFCCPCRIAFHAQFVTQLQAKLQELRTPPDITQLILDNISKNIHTPDHIPPDPHPQTNIGWLMFRRGFISKHFSSNTPRHWTNQMASFLLSNAHDLWTARCNENNLSRTERESAHVKNRMRAKIEELYQLASYLPQDLQSKFIPDPLESFLKKHLRHSLLIWYATTKPALQACLRRTTIHNDISRLPPDHPSNKRIPPDGPDTASPSPHIVLQV
jgi:hypothetical protein